MIITDKIKITDKTNIDIDYKFVLSILKKITEKYNCKIHLKHYNKDHGDFNANITYGYRNKPNIIIIRINKHLKFPFIGNYHTRQSGVTYNIEFENITVKYYFSLFHELKHLLLRREYTPNIYYLNKLKKNLAEDYCNRYAIEECKNLGLHIKYRYYHKKFSCTEYK